MRSSRPVYSTILSLLLTFLLTSLAANVSARASEEEGEDYEVKARVVRISLIKGEATLKRLGNTDWERARLNFPLVEGDTLATDRDSQLEIQIDARNFVRLGTSSMLRIVTLRDEGVALSVVEGTASVRLAKFDRDQEYFEIDAPQTTLAAEKKGLYRIDVAEGRVRFTVTDGGRARIYSETSGFALRDGRSAELVSVGEDAGDWQLMSAGPRDSWDNWVDDRERYLAQRMRYDTQYYDNYVWGAEDLDAYGNWAYVNDYGWIWRPHVTVINNYHNWAPYRYGHWIWVSPYGWTWVGYEPWGWAPYHYGRWVYYNNYWAWCPRSEFYRHRSWWRPALVAFHISIGNHISWYPLSYHHRDPRSRHYRAADRVTSPRRDGGRLPSRRHELANVYRLDPAYVRAVTTLKASDFGSDNAKLEPFKELMARRVISDEPLYGDLPVRPANVKWSREGTSDRSELVTLVKPARVMPAVQLPERSTGAAVRSPGVALDNELRRSRVFGGREPKPANSLKSVDPDVTETRPTGVVVRPAKPVREPADQGDVRRGDSNMRRGERPVNPDTPDTINAKPREREPAVVPISPPAVEKEKGIPVERSPKSEKTEQPIRIRPTPVERRVEPERPERYARPEPSERSETPAPRYEPPARKYEPPAQRSEPRHEPAPRNEPPPQRSEPPARSEPKSEPKPERSTPAKEPDGTLRPAKKGGA